MDVDLDALEGRLTLHKSGDEGKFVGIREGEMAALVRAVRAAAVVDGLATRDDLQITPELIDMRDALTPFRKTP